MSIDWSKRARSRGRHHHLQSDIVDPGTGTSESFVSVLTENDAPAWQPDTAYNDGPEVADFVYDPDNGAIWGCVTSGTSGSETPEWFNAGNFNTTDNDVSWGLVGYVGELPLSDYPNGDPSPVPRDVLSVTMNQSHSHALEGGFDSWQAETAYTAGDRIVVSVSGPDQIWEAVDDFTSGSEEPTWVSPVVGDAQPSVQDGEGGWEFLGFQNEIPIGQVDGSIATFLEGIARVVTDPGLVWQPETDYTTQYILTTNDRVFRVTSPGISGTEEPDWPGTDQMGPNTSVGNVTDGTVNWDFVGVVGQLAYTGDAAVFPENLMPLLFRSDNDDIVYRVESPGGGWEAETLYSEFDRIFVNITGVDAALVLQATQDMTTGSVEPDWTAEVDANGLLAAINDGDGTWIPIGYIGALPIDHEGQLTAIDLIADPPTATAEDVAEKLNELILALRRRGYIRNGLA